MGRLKRQKFENPHNCAHEYFSELFIASSVDPCDVCHRCYRVAGNDDGGAAMRLGACAYSQQLSTPLPAPSNGIFSVVRYIY